MADVWWQRGPKPQDAANAQSNEGDTASGDSPQEDAAQFKDPASQSRSETANDMGGSPVDHGSVDNVGLTADGNRNLNPSTPNEREMFDYKNVHRQRHGY